MDAKKPIVGHNCTYDIMFMLANFQGPLPDNLQEFKSSLKELMPKVCIHMYTDIYIHAYVQGELEGAEA